MLHCLMFTFYTRDALEGGHMHHMHLETAA